MFSGWPACPVRSHMHMSLLRMDGMRMCRAVDTNHCAAVKLCGNEQAIQLLIPLWMIKIYIVLYNGTGASEKWNKWRSRTNGRTKGDRAAHNIELAVAYTLYI